MKRFRGSVAAMNGRKNVVEVLISKKEVEADPRFNVIGEVSLEDIDMLDHIGEGIDVKLIPI
ncbi:phospho-sugar glycosidase domain-containing protein [Saccharolobus islandicus]|uniref:phospho-sugar glycosidase domain-containing protein n=1 Tax=Saccharolobus islandicus TaxID=43080 RepID=UPI00244B6360|nr:phospho-sugar glycosidase domain-containing protein [Sulfolobus islandicus]